MSKPESRFIERVHRYLSKAVHREKMANPFRRGTPDVYYEGPTGILFVEYKFTQRFPKTLLLTSPTQAPHLSPLQAHWLERAQAHRVPVAVVVGSAAGGVVLEQGAWLEPLVFSALTVLTPNAIAHWIEHYCFAGEPTWTRCGPSTTSLDMCNDLVSTSTLR